MFICATARSAPGAGKSRIPKVIAWPTTHSVFLLLVFSSRLGKLVFTGLEGTEGSRLLCLVSAF